MFVLGITGGIGTGKSTVASICRAAGLPVIDADAIAHEITDHPTETVERIAQALGTHLIDKHGVLDREKMAALAFSDKKALDTLSAIVHEAVVTSIDRRIAEAAAGKVKAIVLDVPIPVKRGFLDNADQIWAVSADESVRLSRLRKRGMSDAEAKKRMSVQMSSEQYNEIASHVIDNSGSLRELENRVHALLKQELGIRGIPLPGIPEQTCE